MSSRSSGVAARVLENHHSHGKKNLARVRNTVLAEQDLEEIWLYIAADNIVAADALLDKLLAKSTLLASNAELGRALALRHPCKMKVDQSRNDISAGISGGADEFERRRNNPSIGRGQAEDSGTPQMKPRIFLL